MARPFGRNAEPDQLVRLNSGAVAALSRCDGVRTLAEIVTDLEHAYGVIALRSDVRTFVALPLDKQ
jgi:pyrroloquinoline quinone biosynthesis protein D